MRSGEPLTTALVPVRRVQWGSVRVCLAYGYALAARPRYEWENPRCLDRLQLFAGLESDCLARGDINFLTGAGVATDARLARLDVEDAETAEFNPTSTAQGGLQSFKN